MDVRRGADRAQTRSARAVTAHSLSSGRHYDPTNTSVGALVAYDEHALGPGGGFPRHDHRELEIVSWVLDGALRHADSTGSEHLVPAGSVQVLSAGTGVRHSEHAAGVPTRFVQAWLLPDARGAPTYRTATPPADALAGRLVPLASGLPGHGDALPLRVAATLLVGRLEPGQSLALPVAPRLHVHVARGAVVLDPGGRLRAGDVLRLTGDAAPVRAHAEQPAELLVWELHGPGRVAAVP